MPLSPVAILTGVAAAPAVFAVIAFVPMLLIQAFFSFKHAPLHAIALVALVILLPYPLSSYWRFRGSTLRHQVLPVSTSLVLALLGALAAACALFWAYPVYWGIVIFLPFLSAALYIAWRQYQLRQAARTNEA